MAVIHHSPSSFAIFHISSVIRHPTREPGVYRRPVESSLIRSVGYDVASSVLEIEFAEHGRVYEYFDVPLSVYSELMAAESKGAYFNDRIKDMYPYQETGGAE